MRLLSISGDSTVARGMKGAHYHLLEEFHRYWDRIDILVPHHEEAKAQTFFDNVHFHIAPPDKWARSEWIKEHGFAVMKAHEHNLIAAHDYPPFLHGDGARELTKLTDVPHILEIYHVEGYPVAVDWKDRLRRWYTARYIKKNHPHAKAIRVINDTQIPEWLDKQGVPDDKILKLYSSYIDFETFYEKKLPKIHDVIFIGRLVDNKGLFDLLKAIKQCEGVNCLIAGTGPLESKLKSFCERHKIKDRVQFTSWVEDSATLAQHINESRMLVCCSRSEGGPRTTLEAMACKVPVISTAVGTMLDILKHRVNGCLIDFNHQSLAQEIKWLLSEPEKAKAIGKQGFKDIQKFERKKLIKEYAEGYQALIDS